MQVETSNFQFTDTTVTKYINKLKNDFEKRCQELETKNYRLENKNQQLENSLKQSAIEYEILNEKYRVLLFHRFSRSSEKYLESKDQRLLFNEKGSVEEEQKEEIETTEVKSHKRKKCGRKPLDPNLPREEETIDIPESEKICACGAQLTKIGEETSEKLHIIPQQIFVKVTIRPKYACRHCEGTSDEEEKTVKIAPVPPSIIPRSIASADLLSFIMIHKYQDHIPYYRQETQFLRLGIQLSRQDMSNWQQQIYVKLKPLFCLLKITLKSGTVMQMDETPLQVMGEEDKKDTSKSYMWLARGGPPGKTVVWYEYYPNRGSASAFGFLEGFKGYLQTDGYKTYDSVVKDLVGIIHVGCFAHVRRRFFEAAKAVEKSPLAEEAIRYIKKLYEIETTLRKQELTQESFIEKRKKAVEPILATFKSWLLQQEKEVLPSSALGGAVSYTLKQWDKLVRYLESPYLTPDNNAAENSIRPHLSLEGKTGCSTKVLTALKAPAVCTR